MKNFTLSNKLILQNKNVVILHINLLPEGKNINFATKQIIKFIKNNKKKYTFFIPTFTNRYFYKSGISDYFHKLRKCTNGYFANYLIKSKMGLRSNHPTHSYYFIGKEAKKFISFCDVEDEPFEILNKIGVEKICFLNINSITLPTFHLAENILGYSKNILANFLGSFYKDKSNKILWCRLKYLHGCDTKYNVYAKRYIKNKYINIKKCSNSIIYFGDLFSIFKKDLKFMKNNRKFFNCNKCFYCKYIQEKNKIKVLFNILKNYKLFLSIIYKVVITRKEIKNHYFSY